MNYLVFDIKESINERLIVDESIKKNIDKLIERFTEIPLSRMYSLDNNDDHKIKKLSDSVSDNELFVEKSRLLANDLLRAESVFENGEQRRNKNIKSGILIVRKNISEIIIMKLEEITTINPDDFSINSNIGGEKDYYKIAIIPHQNIHNNIRIIDSNELVSKFWTDKFLEVIPVRDSQKNTEELIDLIKNDNFFNNDLNISDDIKSKIIHDYFKNRNVFSFDDFCNFTNQVIEKDLEIESIVRYSKCNNLDGNFQLDTRSINMYLNRTIKLNDYVTVKIKDIYDAKNAGAIEYDSKTGGIIVFPSDEIELENEIPSLFLDNSKIDGDVQ